MEPANLTVKILEQIRDGVTETNVRIDQTNTRLGVLEQKFDVLTDRVDGLNHRVDGLNDRVDGLANRLVESEIRLGTAITAVAGSLEDVKNLLRDRLDLRDRVERCEGDIVLLKEKTGLK